MNSLMSKGSEFLNVKYPIIGGAMSWISESNLVASISNANGFGVLACGSLSPEELNLEIVLTKEKTKNPFGVNLILAHPQLQDLIEVCRQNKVHSIILAGGIPEKETILKIREFAKVIAFAPTYMLAKRLFKHGVDALILEGSEAGGHIGQVSTLVLIQEILLNLQDMPIFIAGGIARGEIFASMLQLGAYGVQLGTVFAVAQESIAHEKFKQAFLRANSRDANVTIQLDKRIPVMAVRVIENNASIEFFNKQKEVIKKCDEDGINLNEAMLLIEHFWAGSLKRAVIDGDVENGSMMSGQIVGVIKEVKNVEQIFAQILAEAEGFLAKVRSGR